jgi:hypothetical protein
MRWPHPANPSSALTQPLYEGAFMHTRPRPSHPAPHHGLLLGLFAALLMLQSAMAAPPPASISVDMLVCSDGLIVLPTITSPVNAPLTQTFDVRIISGTDRGVAIATVPGQGAFVKEFANLDALVANLYGAWPPPEFRRFSVDWDQLTDPWLQVFSGSDLIHEVAVPSYTDVAFAGGDGTLTNPFLIATAEQLRRVACHPEGLSYYALTQDIDLDGLTFFPIGSPERPFIGGFDGRGRTIANLSINRPGLDRIGFFAQVTHFYLQDVRFDQPTVHGFREVGIVVGRADNDKNSVYRNVTIDGGVARGMRNVGSMIGWIEHGAIIEAVVDAEVFIDPPRYHSGTDAQLVFPLDNQQPYAIGGLVGEGEQLSIAGGVFNLLVSQSDRVASAGETRRIGGMVGYDDGNVQIAGIEARLAIDLTLRDSNGSSGSIAGVLAGDVKFSSVIDSTIHVDIALRDDGRADGGTRQMLDVAAITNSAEEFTVDGVNLSGRILLDASEAVLPVTVRNIGGVYGQSRNRAPFIHRSHVDVDIVIRGANAVVSRVGGLVGLAVRLAATDVRLDGGIEIDAPNATQIGGLIGYGEGAATEPQVVLASVIHRGPAISASDDAVFGTLRGDASPGPFHGASLYWDSDRNGVTSFSPSDFGRPATSAQLGNLTWLTSAGFDANLWCVDNGVPALKRFAPNCTAAPAPDPITVPGAPSNLTITSNHNTIQIAWLPPSNQGNGAINAYLIQYRPLGSNDWIDALPTAPCDNPQPTCAQIPNLESGTTYEIRIAAQNQAGQGTYSTPRRVTLASNTDVPTVTSLIAGTNRAWLILAPPSPNTASFEISLDNGATWNAITPHVGNRVLRVMNLTNGTTYLTRVRAIRSDGSASEPTIAVTMMPTPIRPTAPDLTFALDTTTLSHNASEGSASIDLTLTNAGTIHLNDIWLTWDDVIADALIADLTPITDAGQWVLLDDWWYGENVQLAPGETHRVRITLEIKP